MTEWRIYAPPNPPGERSAQRGARDAAMAMPPRPMGGGGERRARKKHWERGPNSFKLRSPGGLPVGETIQSAGQGPNGDKEIKYCPVCGLRWDDEFQWSQGIHCNKDADGCGAKLKVVKVRE